jgi:hypothetical protein
MVWKHVRKVWENRSRLFGIKHSTPTHPQRLMAHMKQHLNHAFFEALPHEPEHTRVRRFEFEGKRYVIKNTQGHQSHGEDVAFIRKVILAHQKAVRNGSIHPTHYTIRTPKVHGRIRRSETESYIIMQDVGGERRGMANEIYPGNREVSKQSAEAFKELRENFRFLISKDILPTSPKTSFRVPQINEMIFIRHTNPANPPEGKWVVALPYDFG